MPQLKYWNGSAWINASVGAQGTSGANGLNGSQGIQGPSGSQGPTGLQGFNGSQGTQGIQGNDGEIGIRYTFSTTTTDADPGSGIFRYNNATITAVTQIYIDNIDAGGTVDRTTWYDTWDDSSNTIKGTIYIQTAAGTGNVFNVNGPVIAAVGYYKIPVVFVSGSGIPANGTVMRITFARAGDQGIQGTQGVQGTQGTQGLQGLQGLQGAQGAQGLQGTQGTQGAQGTQGSIGLQGLNGAFAAQGIQGTIGITVYDDDQGIISQQVFN